MSEKEKKEEAVTLEDELTLYELGYLVLSTVKEEELEKETAQLKSVIEKNRGLFIGEEGMPKIMKLAYKMVKIIGNKKTRFDSAYFGWVKFEASADSVLKINEEVKKLENVLRFILIKTVRESKFMTQRRPMAIKSKKETPKDEVKEEKPISKVEVDKAIDELVIG
jgi:ribosomal protein S6